MKNLVLAFVAVAIAHPAFAQKKFEGTITFGLEYQDLPAEMAAVAMLPDEMTTQIKGDKTRLEQSLGMGMSQVTITDLKKGSEILLVNMMGNKMAVEMSKDDLKDLKEMAKMKGDKKPEFKYLDGTKEIAGYKCKKAMVVVQGAGEMEIYYTEDLPAGANTQFEGLKGFPLEYTIDSGQFKVKMTAKTVKAEALGADLFVIPDGYDKMTFEEFKTSMGEE